MNSRNGTAPRECNCDEIPVDLGHSESRRVVCSAPWLPRAVTNTDNFTCCVAYHDNE